MSVRGRRVGGDAAGSPRLWDSGSQPPGKAAQPSAADPGLCPHLGMCSGGCSSSSSRDWHSGTGSSGSVGRRLSGVGAGRRPGDVTGRSAPSAGAATGESPWDGLVQPEGRFLAVAQTGGPAGSPAGTAAIPTVFSLPEQTPRPHHCWARSRRCYQCGVMGHVQDACRQTGMSRRGRVA